MKNFLALFFVIIAAVGCTKETTETNFHLVLVPIESYVLPDTLRAETPYDLKLTYRRPSSCYGFNNFYAQKDGNTRTIGIQNIVFENNDCQPLTDAFVEKTFSFFVRYETGVEFYTFRFYKGNGTNGEALFETIDVPVAQ